jgi:acyl-CoA reductase-like NAD-dependent aldehyde dehydrogenase
MGYVNDAALTNLRQQMEETKEELVVAKAEVSRLKQINRRNQYQVKSCIQGWEYAVQQTQKIMQEFQQQQATCKVLEGVIYGLFRVKLSSNA